MIHPIDHGDLGIYNQGEGTGLLLMAEATQEKKWPYSDPNAIVL